MRCVLLCMFCLGFSRTCVVEKIYSLLVCFVRFFVCLVRDFVSWLSSHDAVRQRPSAEASARSSASPRNHADEPRCPMFAKMNPFSAVSVFGCLGILRPWKPRSWAVGGWHASSGVQSWRDSILPNLPTFANVYQAFESSFSSVSKPIFENIYSFCTI